MWNEEEKLSVGRHSLHIIDSSMELMPVQCIISSLQKYLNRK